MDSYDFSEVKSPKRKRPAGILWNILTILVLVAILGISAAFVLIYLNPNSTLNPFPPSPTDLISANATATVGTQFSPNPTSSPTIEIILTTNTTESTPALLFTDMPQVTPTGISTAELVGLIDYAFIPREGSPAAIDAAQFHPEVGCQWLGVAGQATSLNGEAVKGLFVHLGGNLPGLIGLDNLAMTGLAPQYGQGGFEITISDQLIASSDTLWIQLLDQDNLPLSDRVYFDTYDDCTKNLVIIYFDQVR